jgi:hypothetical protein
MSNFVFWYYELWVVTPCSLEIARSLKGQSVSQTSNQQAEFFIFCFAFSSTLKIEAICSSETSNILISRPSNPEYNTCHSHIKSSCTTQKCVYFHKKYLYNSHITKYSCHGLCASVWFLKAIPLICLYTTASQASVCLYQVARYVQLIKLRSPIARRPLLRTSKHCF